MNAVSVWGKHVNKQRKIFSIMGAWAEMHEGMKAAWVTCCINELDIVVQTQRFRYTIERGDPTATSCTATLNNG